MPYYAGTPKNQEQIKYWFKQLKQDKAKSADLNSAYYCVHTVKPEYVVNTHARLYFEDLTSAEKYLEVMCDKEVYATLELPE
jgi:hypothetical protein